MERVGEPFELLFVDDGSSDGTPELLRKVAAARPARPRRALHAQLRSGGRGRGALPERARPVAHPDGRRPAAPARGDPAAHREEGRGVRRRLRRARRTGKTPLFRVAASRAMQWTMRSMMEIELPDDVSTFRLMSAPIARLVAALPGAAQVLQRAARVERRAHRDRERRATRRATPGPRTTASPSS